MEFSDLLQNMVTRNASDVFLSVDAPAHIKIEGKMSVVNQEPLSSTDVYQLVYSILSDDQARQFESTSELNMALRLHGVGRFRINVFRQMGEIALVARHIKSEIPSIEALGLPLLLQDLILEQHGLILLVGGTGTGKSTTMASMVDYRNSNTSGHILTIEDPVEFVHEHKLSLVNQREVGLDTESYDIALKNAMREAPDVIMIGEIRDMDTMKSAIAYAETGHLCVSTLHANNANQAIDRVLNFFPERMHQQVLQDLSLNLKSIVSQRLPIGVQGKRIAAVEVLLNTPYISDLILKGNVSKIKEAMIQARTLGCQTFDDALFELVQAGKLDEDEALRYADSRNNLTLRFKLERKYTQSDLKIKKNIAYNKFVDFSIYSTFCIKKVRVSAEDQKHATKFESAIRQALFHKSLREDKDEPELEFQYLFASRKHEATLPKDIDNPVVSEIDMNNECKKHGLLRINVVDLQSRKVIWQVTASRELAGRPRSQSDVNKYIAHLLSEFETASIS